MPDSRPVGLYDSGIGGLTVLRELHRLLPTEDFVYFADNAHFPYGKRALADVRRLAHLATERLLAEEAKLIVVACNTASGAAVKQLRQRFEVPFVAMVPGVKPAVLQTRSGKVLILATEGALRAELYADVMRDFGRRAHVETIPGTALISLIEEDRIERPAVEGLLHGYLDGPLERGCDVVVLGCTHYGFVREVVEDFCGPEVKVIDTAQPVARQAARVLAERDLLNPKETSGTVRFLASGDLDRVRAAGRLLGLEEGEQHSFRQAAAAER